MTAHPQQEPQSERAAVQLTPSEKAALKLVSLFDEITESALLRDNTVAQIVDRAADIRRSREPAETGAA